MASAYERLMNVETEVLREHMLQASESHAAMCAIASDKPDPHASRQEMEQRVAKLSKEDLARALAPLVDLAEIAHEHHEGHAGAHG